VMNEETRAILERSPWMVRCDKSPFHDSIHMHVYRYRPERPHIEVVRGFETERVEEDAALGAPTLSFGGLGRPGSFFAGAQELMDDLWRCGIRPTDGAGTAGSMAATERHLEDMRKLVFEKWLRK